MSPLWRKAPLALVRFPGILAALAVSAVLLALAAASSPMFISSAASSALRDDLGHATVYGAGMRLSQSNFAGFFGPTGGPPLATRDRAAREALGRLPHTGPVVSTVLGSTVVAGRGREMEVRLLARTGAFEHVRKVAGSSGEGVWIADSVASELHVRSGDDLTLAFTNSFFDRRAHRVAVHVDGVYRALWKERETPYWRLLWGDIYPHSADAPPPPEFVLGSERSIRSIARRILASRFELTWEAPLDGRGLTVPQARELNRRFERLRQEISNPATELGSNFACERCAPPAYESLLPTILQQAEDTIGAIRGPADLLSATGSLVALAVVAAAGAFALARRRIEARLLFARGVAPAGYGARAAAEALLPLLLGTAAGIALSRAIVALVGPGPVDGHAVRDGALAALERVPVAAALVGLVAAVLFVREEAAASPRRSRLGRIPWEAPVLALAAFFLERLLAGRGFVGGGSGGVARPSVYLLLFPVFLLAGLSGLATRALRIPLYRAAQREGAARTPAAFLAVRRLAGAQRLALVLVTACALALGIFVYAQTVVSSYSRTVEAKAVLLLGSDVQGTISPNNTLPADFPFPATKVTRLYQGAALSDSARLVDVLAIRPRSFRSVAYWEPAYAEESFGQLLARLHDDQRGPLPVLLAAGGGTDGRQTLQFDSGDLPVDVVGTVRAFPGMSRDLPLVVADFGALDRRLEQLSGSNPLREVSAFTELWVKGNPRAAAHALALSPAHPQPILTVEEARRDPSVTAFTRTFSFLQALGFAAGFLAVAGLLLYLQARQRSRALAYALSRRMGLARPTQALALALELGLMLAAAFALATVISLATARLVLTRIEPLASLSPVPLFSTPVVLLAATLGALLGAVLVGAWLAIRSAERTNVAEVMRLET